ncbi:MAG: M1 family metallopeptidase [Chitinophagaceae bacterium]
MRSIVLFLLFIAILPLCSLGQPLLYMPRDVKAAFKKGTRSPDGKPGKNYWQNYARYTINITALPPNRIIKGTEIITYINNSPDTLTNPVIKLFLNIHKPGAPRNGGALPEYLTEGIEITKFGINGKSLPWPKNPYNFTVQSFRLPKKLLPKDSVQLNFEWQYEVSLQSNREGMIDSTTYFLAYFYPRVAVYDDYNGWDIMPFMEDHEFYSDFNDYAVTLNVPKNYIVWGTGTLLQPEKMLQPAIANRFQESLQSNNTIHIATIQELMAKKVTLQNEINTWKFIANNIPDMAFGISDHFVWDAGSVVVDSNTKRRGSVQAAYNDTAKDYREMVSYAKQGLQLLSFKWPGIPYPYEKTTIFQGYAGMEYPMMANDETYEDTVFSRFVAEHEIAHTYMPFYMGINETRYGFMDEGWATTFELLLAKEHLGTETAEEFYRQFRVYRWIEDPSADQDIPIITPADALSGGGFGNNMYGKASLGYLAAKEILGDELFKKCLHEYIARWNGKHPLPWDFFNTFNNVSGKNLNWFWNNWFFTNGYIDLAVTNVVKNTKGFSVSIQNIGGFVSPVDIVVTFSEGSTETFHQSPLIWQNNQLQSTINIASKKKPRSIKLDGRIYVDADPSNNVLEMK